MNRPQNLAQLLQDMRGCEQTRGQSVLAHGEGVWATFEKMLAHLRDPQSHPAKDWWRLPNWLTEESARVLQGLPPLEVMREYLVHHDCGKPYCLQIDAEGRRHFPGHAAMSQEIWLSIGGSPEAAELMFLDMEAHLLKAEGIASFAARPQALTLLLSATAEVHANAEMFGGVDSDSFKIKAKNLTKRGGQAVQLIIRNATAPKGATP